MYIIFYAFSVCSDLVLSQHFSGVFVPSRRGSGMGNCPFPQEAELNSASLSPKTVALKGWPSKCSAQRLRHQVVIKSGWYSTRPGLGAAQAQCCFKREETLSFLWRLHFFPRGAAFKLLNKGSYKVTSSVPVTLCTYPAKQYCLALRWVTDLEWKYSNEKCHYPPRSHREAFVELTTREGLSQLRLSQGSWLPNQYHVYCISLLLLV